VNAAQPPVFSVHGNADPQVSDTQSRRFFQRCQEVGARCEVVIREGAGHGGWQEMGEDNERMVEWFDLHLLGKQPAKAFTFGVSSAPSTPISKPAASAPVSLHTEEGWRELFNGKDLTGWNANLHPDSWSIVDGTIKARAIKPSSHLFFVGDKTEGFETFKNFELEVVTRSEPKSNSGIFIQTDKTATNWASHLDNGYEIQLNSTKEEKRKTGSLYAVVDLDKSSADESQWFKVRITVRNKQITIQVNDETVVEYTEPENVVRSAARAGRKLNPEGGAIALQAHDSGSVFYFKNIRIRPLP